MSMTKSDHESAARGYRPPPSETGRGRRVKVEIPVIRDRRENNPSLPIYSGQSANKPYVGPDQQQESYSRPPERSSFRTGFGFGLGFATGTALFRLVAVLIFYGVALAVVLGLLRMVF
jgi:hypothetical protein